MTSTSVHEVINSLEALAKEIGTDTGLGLFMVQIRATESAGYIQISREPGKDPA